MRSENCESGRWGWIADGRIEVGIEEKRSSIVRGVRGLDMRARDAMKVRRLDDRDDRNLKLLNLI